MFKKKPLYIVLLVLFSLLLVGVGCLYFLLPDASFTAPEGMTAPSGDSSGEMPSFDTSSGETPSFDTFSGEMPSFDTSSGETPSFAGTATETTGLMSVLYALKKWALPIGGFCLLMIAFCVFMLIRISKKQKRLKAKAMEEEDDEDDSLIRKNKVWPGVVCLLLAVGLVMALFSNGASSDSSAQAVEALETAQAVTGSLTTRLAANGSLSEEESVSVTVPGGVTLLGYLIENGDTVKAGQAIARVDVNSVLESLASLQEAMDALDAELTDAAGEKISSTLKAKAPGRVKEIYANAGDSVLAVMNEYGALARLSLDGYMAVDISLTGDYARDDSVTVRLSDGTEVSGRIDTLLEGKATVLVSDEGPRYGESVTVLNESGETLGTGTLYIHSELKITGFTGTVLRVGVKEEAKVSAAAALFILTDTSYDGTYETLLKQREEYEAEQEKLFALYEAGYVYASVDGVVSGIPEDAEFVTLSAGESVLKIVTLSGPGDGVGETYVHYLAKVTGRTDGTVTMLASSVPVSVSDYRSLSSISASLSAEGSYTIPSSASIYLYSGGWGTVSVDIIRENDLLLFVFDQSGALQFVICQHTTAAATATPAPDPTATPSPSSTAEASAGEATATPAASGYPGGGGTGGGTGGGSISFGGGGSAAQQEEEGYTISQQELCVVTPQENMLLTVTVDELDILLVKEGQQAEILLDALSGQSFTGVVTKIAAEGTNGGGDTKFTVTLTAARTNKMLPGMNATAYIPLSETEGLLLIPAAALQEEGSYVYVYTGYDEDKGELINPVAVTTGLSDGENVAILSGLSEGDICYYLYADAVTYATA